MAIAYLLRMDEKPPGWAQTLIEHAAAARGDLDALRTGLGAVHADLGALQTEFDAQRADLGALRTGFDAQRADLGALRTDLAALRADLGALRTDLAALHTEFDAFRATVATREELHRTRAEIMERIDRLQSAVTRQQQEEAVNYNLTATTAGRLVSLEESLIAVTRLLRMLQSRVDDLEGRQRDH